MNPLTLTRSVRSLNRLRQIAQVLTRHGFGHIVTQINLARFVPVWMLRKKVPSAVVGEGATSIGRRLALVCGELGPTFVKLGQMMSTRPDIVPDEVLAFHEQWDGLRQKVQDDRRLCAHPAEFVAAVQPVMEEDLSEANIKAAFEGLGQALKQATRRWKG